MNRTPHFYSLMINAYPVLFDILSEDEHKAIVEIIDSLILAEITRSELSAYKIEQRLKNS